MISQFSIHWLKHVILDESLIQSPGMRSELKSREIMFYEKIEVEPRFFSQRLSSDTREIAHDSLTALAVPWIIFQVALKVSIKF